MEEQYHCSIEYIFALLSTRVRIWHGSRSPKHPLFSNHHRVGRREAVVSAGQNGCMLGTQLGINTKAHRE